MRDATYYIAVSLDGRIAAPDGDFSAFPESGDHMDVILNDYTDTVPAHVQSALGLRADGSRFDTVMMGWNTYTPVASDGHESPSSTPASCSPNTPARSRFLTRLEAEELEDTTALMFGCRSYEAFAPFWRDSEDHAAYKELPKYVVSTTLAQDALVTGWGPTTILRSTEDVATLKASHSGGIFIHGSAELARRLSDANLIDQYNLLVFPVLLGAGKSIFSTSDRDKQSLALRESAAYSNGVMKVVYDVTH